MHIDAVHGHHIGDAQIAAQMGGDGAIRKRLMRMDEIESALCDPR